jgi:hypothetical protein
MSLPSRVRAPAWITRPRRAAGSAALVAMTAGALAGPALLHAQTVYTDRAAFEAALGAVTRYFAGDVVPQTHHALAGVGTLTVVPPTDMWLIPNNPGDQAHIYAGRRAVFGVEPDAPLDDFPFSTLESPVQLFAFGTDIGIPSAVPLALPTVEFSFNNGFSIDRLLVPNGPVTDPNKVFEFFGVIFPTAMTFTQVTYRGFDAGDPSFDFVVLNNVSWDQITIAAVPEPGTIALVGGGLLALAGVARRRRAVWGTSGAPRA